MNKKTENYIEKNHRINARGRKFVVCIPKDNPEIYAELKRMCRRKFHKQYNMGFQAIYQGKNEFHIIY